MFRNPLSGGLDSISPRSSAEYCLSSFFPTKSVPTFPSESRTSQSGTATGGATSPNPSPSPFTSLTSAYDALLPLAWKADLARLVIIHEFGGWFSDSKQVLLKPLDEWNALWPDAAQSAPVFFCDRPANTFQNALFGAPPKHPWIARSLQIFVAWALARKYPRESNIGPLAMGEGRQCLRHHQLTGLYSY